MICEVCGIRPATEIHHKFSQTRLNKKLYPDFIHNHKNLVNICQICHHFKALPKWNESKFAKEMGIVPRSKTATTKRMLENG